MVDPRARAETVDYDTDPARSQTGVLEKYRFGDDMHREVADRIAAERLGTVLHVGCGRGTLGRLLLDVGAGILGFDASPTMLRMAPGPRVRGDARSLPFADESFDCAAALYMLYHLPDPPVVIAECRRVLKPGGLFIACAPSRNYYPELLPYLPEEFLTFDAEIAPELIGEHFQEVELDRWDLPYYRLPDREAVELYLYGHQYPKDVVERAAGRVEAPLTVTARGAMVYAHKRR